MEAYMQWRLLAQNLGSAARVKQKLKRKYDVIAKEQCIKDVRSQGGRGLSSTDIFRTRKKTDADVRTF